MSSDAALNTLKTHGKSFRFAGAFLSKSQLNQAAQLYQFCRWIDDIADESEDKLAAEKQLISIQNDLKNGHSDDAQTSSFIALQNELNMPAALPTSLIDGVLSDLVEVAIQTEADLLRYAYRVAGTVGLMMCPILKADPRGHPHAVDLGIAMQLTNIARDVMEDARLARRYLPYDWCPLSPQQIVDNTLETRTIVQEGISQLLFLAESYYTSGADGYRYLPPRSRRAIKVAAAVYREIGKKLAANGLKYWEGRTVVSLPHKLQVALSLWFNRRMSANDAMVYIIHDQRLHKDLQDVLPDWTRL
jgi:phytoene synthase